MIIENPIRLCQQDAVQTRSADIPVCRIADIPVGGASAHSARIKGSRI
ncbi:MAG: hypothetical protein JWQ04_1109, partial [Pedosphaera sp.]|nr:hypothetical protein [Pedosphaera sp.]